MFGYGMAMRKTHVPYHRPAERVRFSRDASPMRSDTLSTSWKLLRIVKIKLYFAIKFCCDNTTHKRRGFLRHFAQKTPPSAALTLKI